MCVCATSLFFLSPNCSPGRPQLSGYCSDGLLWAFKKKVKGSNRRKGHQKRAYLGLGVGGGVCSSYELGLHGIELRRLQSLHRGLICFIQVFMCIPPVILSPRQRSFLCDTDAQIDFSLCICVFISRGRAHLFHFKYPEKRHLKCL